MTAAYVSNLVINAGASFNQTFNLSNTTDGSYLDLSLYSISAQMRKHAVSSVKTEFSTSIEDASQGKFALSLTSEQTTSLKPGRYVYDVVLTVTGTTEKTRVVEGMVLVREGVTR